MQGDYKFLDTLRGCNVGCDTWGVVDKEGVVVVGRTSMSVANPNALKNSKVGDAVELRYAEGKLVVKNVYGSCEWVKASITTGAGGAVLFTSRNAKALQGSTIFPREMQTVCFNVPKPFFNMGNSASWVLYIPETDVYDIIRVGHQTGVTTVVTGVPDFNKVALLGGSKMKASEFVHDDTDGLFCVKDGEVYSVGLVMLTERFTCVIQHGKLMVPDYDIEVCISDFDSSRTYQVDVPKQILDMKEPMRFYPYTIDGEQMFTSMGETFSDNAQSGLVNQDVQWFANKLMELYEDQTLCQEIAPLARALEESLPAAIRGRDNVIVQIINLASSYTGVKVQKSEPVKKNPRALPSDIV